MEKFYLKNGKEVQLGDTINHCTEGIDPQFGKVKTFISTTLTKNVIPLLLDAGIITKSPTSTTETKHTVSYYIEKLATKHKWKPVKMARFLDEIAAINPTAAYGIILREVAIDLDAKYSDHIENSPEIYAISSVDGRITKVYKAAIKNYRNFAAFRTIEDAKLACKIMSPILKTLYAKNNK